MLIRNFSKQLFLWWCKTWFQKKNKELSSKYSSSLIRTMTAFYNTMSFFKAILKCMAILQSKKLIAFSLKSTLITVVKLIFQSSSLLQSTKTLFCKTKSWRLHSITLTRIIVERLMLLKLKRSLVEVLILPKKFGMKFWVKLTSTVMEALSSMNSKKWWPNFFLPELQQQSI